MPAGFQVWGDHGLLQIDDSYSNLALVARGTVTRNGANQSALVPVTVTVANPMVAVSSPSCFVYLANSVNNGNGTWTFYFGFAFQEATATVNYYVFGLPTTQGNAGIQVFRPDGVLAFDATRPYLVAYNFLSMPDTSSPARAPDYNATIGIGPYAWVLGDPGTALEGFRYQPVAGNPQVGVRTYTKWMARGGAGIGFTLSLRLEGSAPSDPAGTTYFPAFRRPQSALIIDISGY